MTKHNAAPSIEHVTYINAPPGKVYETLTTGAGWDAWFTNGTTLDARRGGFIRIRWKDFGAGHWTLEDGGPVLEAVPNRTFAFQWSPSGSPTRVSFTLKRLGKGTHVTLKESGYRLTREHVKALAGCAVGWGEALTLLKVYLEHGVTYGRVPKGRPKA